MDMEKGIDWSSEIAMERNLSSL